MSKYVHTTQQADTYHISTLMKSTGTFSAPLTNMKPDANKISLININGTLPSNGQITAKAFNNYFTSTAQNILTDNFNNTNVSANSKNPLPYTSNAFNQSFPDIKFNMFLLKK
jgi:hypothetical protein